MRDLQDFVKDYVAALSGPHADDAWHSLVEAGPAALPYLVEEYNASRDPAVRLALVEIVGEYRSADATAFLVTCLQNGDGDIWKVALDGLVSLGGRAALDVLSVARETASPRKREWIEEAVEQIRQASRPG